MAEDLARLLREAELVAKELEKRRAKGLPSDAVSFARLVGMTADAWQERVLRWTGKRLLLNCSRQAGKSTTTAVLALHRALTAPKSLILLISPSDRQSGELFRKVLDAMNQLPSRPTMTEDNKRSLTFSNGSRIVSLPSSEATIRGYSAVSLILVDEAAFVDDGLIVAVRPMLAVSDGQMVMMSTPNGRRGAFFEAWDRGGPVWERVLVTADQITRISRAFLEEERRVLGERYRQEYEGAFINAATGLVYGGFDEQRNVIEALPPWMHPRSSLCGATPENLAARRMTWKYAVGIDFGVRDKTAFSVVAWRPHDKTVYVVESYGQAGMGPTEAAEEFRRLEESYKFAVVVGDIGGLGKGFAVEMQRRHNIPVQAAAKHDKYGYLLLFNAALRDGSIKVVGSRCQQLIAEWVSLPWHENGQREADSYPADCSDSCLYAWRAAWAYLAKPAPEVPDEGTAAWERQAFERRRKEFIAAQERRPRRHQ